MRSLLFRESEWLSPNGRGGDLFSVVWHAKRIDMNPQNTWNTHERPAKSSPGYTTRRFFLKKTEGTKYWDRVFCCRSFLIRIGIDTKRPWWPGQAFFPAQHWCFYFCFSDKDFLIWHQISRHATEAAISLSVGLAQADISHQLFHGLTWKSAQTFVVQSEWII